MANAVMLIGLFWMLGALWTGSVARAESLADPLRPPLALSDAAVNQPESRAESGLQTIWLPNPAARAKDRKAFAVINGVRVRVGDVVGDQENLLHVVKITEQEVVLKSAEGLKTLRIAPDVTKTNSVTPAAVGKKSISRKISVKENP